MSLTEKQVSLASVPIFAGASTAILTNTANALSAAVDFSPANAAIAGYSRGVWVLSATAGAAPTVPSGWSVYLLRSFDGGTTFETDPGRSADPVAAPVALIPAAAADNAAFVRGSEPVDAPPPLTCQVILVNDGTGQQLNAGWSLSYVPIGYEGI